MMRDGIGRATGLSLSEIFEAIADLSPSGRVTALRWRAGGLPRVERRPALTMVTGKILHVHQRSPAGPQ